MTLFHPLPAGDDRLLQGFRLVFGSYLALSLVLGLVAIRRRDVARHRAWMLRGYAIGMGAGTQVLTHLPWVLLIGQPEGLVRAGLMAAGWLVNLAVAEWLIRGPGPTGGDHRRRPVTPADGLVSQSELAGCLAEHPSGAPAAGG
jgi:hypothetical protein